MIIKETTQVGNPIIRKISKALKQKEINSKETKKIIKDLVDSMRKHELVGMAAPQIGINLRIFVTEIRKTKNRKPKDLDKLRVFINPQIISLSDEKVSGYEGCGSVGNANLFGSVDRPKSVKLKAQDAEGRWFELSAFGLLSRLVQHEYDHLNGIVFVDKVTNTKSFMSKNEYVKKFKK